MSRRRMGTARRAGVALVAALALGAAGGCGGTSTEGTTPGTAPAVLGPVKPATGTPIKVGLVSDGKAGAADASGELAGAKAAVDYANERLGGLNGHTIELVTCETGGTPTGGTNCGTQMVRDQVAAVLVSRSGQSGTIFAAINGSAVPYVGYVAIDPELFVKPGAFLLTNPVASVGAGIVLAKDKGNRHAAIVLPDVPAASGIGAITDPVYGKAQIELSTIPVALQTPDVTPQIQQAVGSGVDQFQIAGTDELITGSVKALKQMAFPGTIIVASETVGPMLADQVPDGTNGVYNLTNTTNDPADPDVQRFGAVIDTYASGTSKTDNYVVSAYALTLGFVRALTGATSAVDAGSVMTAMAAMPQPVDLPMGGGITFQCGSAPVSFAANICTGQTLQSTLDDQGRGTDYQVVDVSAYTKLT